MVGDSLSIDSLLRLLFSSSRLWAIEPPAGVANLSLLDSSSCIHHPFCAISLNGVTNFYPTSDTKNVMTHTYANKQDKDDWDFCTASYLIYGGFYWFRRPMQSCFRVCVCVVMPACKHDISRREAQTGPLIVA